MIGKDTLQVMQEHSKIEKKDLMLQSEETRRNDIDSVDYLLPLENSKPRTEAITHVMVHFISNAARNPEDPYNTNDIYSIFEEYGVSAHYMIGRDGTVFRLVSEDRVAYHAGAGELEGYPDYKDSLNEFSIGIELLAIGTREEMFPAIPVRVYNVIDPRLVGYTDEQYESLNVLLDDIFQRNPSIIRDRNHVIGHDEYAPGRKADPGSLFDWSKLGL
ncbi:N-acetylmuramoyl-L-alanine amidase [Alkalihalobacterium sp. APHAB7]|uniref:N-acetylmuramoyl-L-alanine amidase n=1 Tax=Alkalihalobacterium sp. APHAB7 TaxID=3402081 RepID=UPI003AAD5960